jgi:hypothetical protein
MSVLRKQTLACPYFIPREILNDGWWPHPSRLPLAAGWSGDCCASGTEKAVDETHIHDFCNLGNATACAHLPGTRDWDAVRFSVAKSSVEQITINYTCELAHAPITYGTLIYDLAGDHWREAHPDARVDRLATSYLRAYRLQFNRSFV